MKVSRGDYDSINKKKQLSKPNTLSLADDGILTVRNHDGEILFEYNNGAEMTEALGNEFFGQPKFSGTMDPEKTYEEKREEVLEAYGGL